MALCQATRALSAAAAQPLPLRRRPARCAARQAAVCAQRPASTDQASARIAAASFAAAVVLAGALAAPMPALAIPQTSACATASCDDGDYSKRDLRKEFYTKGSLKRANLCAARLALRTPRCRSMHRLGRRCPACGALCALLTLPCTLQLWEQPVRRHAVRRGAQRAGRRGAMSREALAAGPPLTRHPARARRERRTFRAPALSGRCAFASFPPRSPLRLGARR